MKDQAANKLSAVVLAGVASVLAGKRDPELASERIVEHLA